MHLFLIIVLITDCILFALSALPPQRLTWEVPYLAVVPLLLNLVALLFVLGVIHA